MTTTTIETVAQLHRAMTFDFRLVMIGMVVFTLVVIFVIVAVGGIYRDSA